MAANSSSLKFVVEVSADQADRALKSLTTSFNEAGVAFRAQAQTMGGAAKSAGAEVVSLGDRIKSVARDQRSEARAASYYVQEIAQIAPISNSAKIALGGLGEALIGGAGIGAAVAIVTAGIRLMAEAWRESAREAAKFADDSAKAIDDLDKRLESARGTPAADRTFGQWQLTKTQIDDRNTIIGQLREANRIEAENPASLRNDTLIKQNEELIEKYEQEIGQLQRRADKLAQIAQLEAQAADAAGSKSGGVRAARGSEMDLKSYDASAKGDYRYNMPSGGPDVPFSMLPLPSDKRKGAKDYDVIGDAQRRYNEELKASIALSEQWGSTLGGVFGQLATGQMSAQQALAAIGQMMIQQITQIAIQSITASASKAGAEAAASQAGIPIVGPALAISAMGAMMSAVLGLLGNVGKRAAGGPVLAGSPYLVGERGPELFVPSASGGIVPNHKLGGSGMNVSIVAMDGRSVERVLTDNDGQVARAQRKMRRRRRG